MTAENPDRPTVRITDRRHFDGDGSPRIPDEESSVTSSATSQAGGAGPREGLVTPGQAPPPRSSTGEAPGTEFTVEPSEPGAAAELPSMDFATLVLSFRASALVHLGLVPDPAIGRGEVNLDGARQMIDILTVLREKTAGNLTPDERDLLDQVLYDLQLHYVNLTGSESAR